MFESPAKRKFVTRKMNTGQGSRPKRNIGLNSPLTKSRNVEDQIFSRDQERSEGNNGRPLSKRTKKRGLDKLYEDEGLVFIN